MITAMNRKVRRPPPRAATPSEDTVTLILLQDIARCAVLWWLNLADPPILATRLKDPMAGAKTKQEKALAKAIFTYYDEVRSAGTGNRSTSASARR